MLESLENAVWIRAGVIVEQLAEDCEDVMVCEDALELVSRVSLVELDVDRREVEVVEKSVDDELALELWVDVDPVELDSEPEEV